MSPLLLLLGCATWSSFIGERRPNLLLVTLDTTRWDAVSSFGGPPGLTPNLERLAKEGARFQRAYTVTPLTIPAHSSILTGLVPPRHGVRDNGDFFLADGADTVAERLHGAGYRTMASVGAEVTSHHWGFAQGFDRFYDDMGRSADRNRWSVERPAEAVVDDALSWFAATPVDDTPWFAWVHVFDAHSPYRPPPDAARRAPGDPYRAEVAHIDDQLGRLLDALEARGDLDHTWVVVTADHGEGLGDHGESMHGVLIYDSTMHVPLLVRPPPGGRVAEVSTPVSVVDITPTLLARAGLPADPSLDGSDLWAWVEDPARPAGPVYLESLYAWHHFGWAPQRGWVDPAWTWLETGRDQLYAAADTRQEDDRAAAEPATARAMAEALAAFDAARPTEPWGATPAARSSSTTAQLQALGYLTGSAPTTDLATAWAADLADPRDRLPLLGGLERARQALENGDLPRARALAEKVIAEDPGLADPRVLLATIQAQQGELDAAIATVQALEESHPGANSAAMLGQLLFQKGQLPEALASFELALQRDPYLAGAWSGWLTALFVANDPRLDEEIAEAREKLPDAVTPKVFQGLRRVMAGDVVGAEPLLSEALADEPGHPMLQLAWGLVQKAKGHNDAAETAFLDEVNLHPPALPARRQLVILYADQRRYPEQVEQLNVIRGLLPDEVQTIHSLAQATYNLRDFPGAHALLEECIQKAPGYAPCHMLRANALKKLGKEAEAQAAYRLALELAGQSPPEAAPMGSGPPPAAAPAVPAGPTPPGAAAPGTAPTAP